MCAASTKSSSDVKTLGGEGNGTVTAVQASKNKVALDPASSGIPYVKPAWSAPPGHPFKLEVLKEGVIVSNFDVYVLLALQSAVAGALSMHCFGAICALLFRISCAQIIDVCTYLSEEA